MNLTGIIKKYHRPLFYGCWLLLSIGQAIFTQLQEDEAYYWLYSKFPAWGYFDHPPMIAFVIKLGTLIANSELAVRLGCILMNLATLWITEKLIDNKNQILFYCICFSLGVLQIGGILAVPDIPLIFFTSLFLYRYKLYLKKSTWLNALWLSVAGSCMIYSKYHAVLIFLFILLSNFSLLKDKKLYVALCLLFLSFLPHLWWQYHHHWVTFTYQLFERSSGPYDFAHTTDYLAGQIAIAGPIAGFIFWPAIFMYHSKNLFERGLKFISIGLLFFFLLSSYKGRVEGNWTAPAIISIIVLGHHFLMERHNWRKWLYRLLPVSLALIFAIRAVVVFNIIPSKEIVEKFFGWKDWVHRHKSLTPDLPAVFLNSYARASEYWFYSGRMTYSLNNYYDRQNNYNYWPIEDSLLGKNVYILDIYKTDSFPHFIQAPIWKAGYGVVTNYHSFVKIILNPSFKHYIINNKDSLHISFSTEVPSNYLNYLKHHPQTDERIILGILKNDEHFKDYDIHLSVQQLIQNPNQNISIYPDIPVGEYTFLFAINSSAGMYTANSRKIKLTIR